MAQPIHHIGIVACSYEGASLCYQTICKEAATLMGSHAHPEVSLHNHPLHIYMEYIYKDDWKGVAGLMLDSAEKLSKAGADFLVCPDNTIHRSWPYIIKKSPLPWLHIAEEVVEAAGKNKYKKLGILGTRYLMEGPVYPEQCNTAGLEYVIPAEEERKKISDIIFTELVYGNIQPASKKYFLTVIDELKSKGCDAVVLGCTEIPLIVMPEESSLPVLDSTRLLARAALQYAINSSE